MNGNQAKRGYHHGDARAALVRAAGELLEDVGAANLSLRAVAERAGLSRQAPYNHFDDKQAMLAELVVMGFDRLTREMQAVSEREHGEDALAATGEAYIAFAQASPALFRLMFARELVDIAAFPDAAASASRAAAILDAVVQSLASAEKASDLGLAAWCIVHGYATLCNEAGIEDQTQGRSRARQFAALLGRSLGKAASGAAPLGVKSQC